MPYKDPDIQKQRKAQIRKRRAEFVRLLKDNKNCMDCGLPYPWYILQFDHVRGEKLFDISRKKGTYSERRLLEEIDKCDLVCANCHAERTYQRYVMGCEM